MILNVSLVRWVWVKSIPKMVRIYLAVFKLYILYKPQIFMANLNTVDGYVLLKSYVKMVGPCVGLNFWVLRHYVTYSNL